MKSVKQYLYAFYDNNKARYRKFTLRFFILLCIKTMLKVGQYESVPSSDA